MYIYSLKENEKTWLSPQDLAVLAHRGLVLLLGEIAAVRVRHQRIEEGPEVVQLRLRVLSDDRRLQLLVLGGSVEGVVHDHSDHQVVQDLAEALQEA